MATISERRAEPQTGPVFRSVDRHGNIGSGNGAYVDLPRAIALLERALARPVKDAASWNLPRRLAELREGVGVR